MPKLDFCDMHMTEGESCSPPYPVPGNKQVAAFPTKGTEVQLHRMGALGVGVYDYSYILRLDHGYCVIIAGLCNWLVGLNYGSWLTI